MNHICESCSKYGLQFCRKYAPQKFFEGRTNSLVWIVGLNPYAKQRGTNDTRTKEELERCFEGKIAPNFNRFKTVSKRLFDMLGQGKAGHTDIVKCYAPKFPKGAEAKEVVCKCRGYLEKQLRESEVKPKLIVCDGRPVCQLITEIVRPAIDPPASLIKAGATTFYSGKHDGNDIDVVLSAFVGSPAMNNNYRKRQLEQVINTYLDKLGIG